MCKLNPLLQRFWKCLHYFTNTDFDEKKVIGLFNDPIVKASFRTFLALSASSILLFVLILGVWGKEVAFSIGPIGDFLAGTIGVMASLFTLILLIVDIGLQKKEMNDNRESEQEMYVVQREAVFRGMRDEVLFDLDGLMDRESRGGGSKGGQSNLSIFFHGCRINSTVKNDSLGELLRNLLPIKAFAANLKKIDDEEFVSYQSYLFMTKVRDKEALRKTMEDWSKNGNPRFQSVANAFIFIYSKATEYDQRASFDV